VGYSYQREVAGKEEVAEVYYNLFLTDHLAVIGNVEWLITGPNLVTGKTNHDVVIPGLRATVGF
jgi:carbohydrate-selective porin OprB